MYLNQRISDDVSYGFRGGPEYKTEMSEMDNGGERANGCWLYPKHRYSATYGHFTKTQKAELLAAFHVCGGRLHAFRFKDWNDFEAIAEPLAPVISTSTPLQLVRTYSFGGQIRTRLIKAPVAGAAIKRNGTAVSGTLDTETGLFTPAAAWVAGTYTWDGEHDVWVRFAEDYNELVAHRPKGWTGQIELLERRRP